MSAPARPITGSLPRSGLGEAPSAGAPGRGWMIAFFALVLLVAVAAAIAVAVLRSGRAHVAPALAPSAVDFGQQELRTQSAVQTVTLTSGSGAVRVASIAIEGPQAADFRLTGAGTCAAGGAVPASSACTVGVRFRPGARAERVAELVVRLEDGKAPLRIPLRGRGAGAPAAVVETARLDLGRVLVGKARTRRIVVSNAGNVPLAIRSLAVRGQDAAAFRIVRRSTTCSPTRRVPPGKSCVIAVAFAPGAEGRAAATLLVVHDGPRSPTAIALRAAGAGVAAPALSVRLLSFGAVPVGARSAPRHAVLTNAGTGAMRVGRLALTGSDPSDFALTGGGCREGMRLAAGASCTLALVFTPTATGDRSATLEVSSGAALVASLELHGRGSAPMG